MLRLAGELGMVKLGNLATDGTKMRANASRHKAMSYGYMNKEIARLEAEIERLLRDAERRDAEQDAALGSRRGDELPDELKRREDRLARIREAKARLEERGPSRVRKRSNAAATRPRPGAMRRAASAAGKEPAPIEWSPEDKAQTNFTDPEAKIMKQSNKGFDYSYNAQAVVDGEDQIIVAAEVTAATNDKQQAVPMATSGAGEPGGGRDRAAAGGRRGRAPIRTRRTPATSARERSRVWSGSAWTRTWRSNARSIMRTSVGLGAGGLPAEASAKERMRAKLRTATGKVLYAARKRIVEPVFGQIEVGAGHPRVPVARPGEGHGGVATDLPDAQSAEDLAALPRRRRELRGIVRTEGWAEADRGRGPDETRGPSRDTDKFSDTLLATWPPRRESSSTTPGAGGTLRTTPGSTNLRG